MPVGSGEGSHAAGPTSPGWAPRRREYPCVRYGVPRIFWLATRPQL